MSNLAINIKGVGNNELSEIWSQLNGIVKDNFDTLFIGACRLDIKNGRKYLNPHIKVIPADYYAPNRVQINKTRLHQEIGLKYADGHKYNSDFEISEAELINTINDLNVLFEAASKQVKASKDVIKALETLKT